MRQRLCWDPAGRKELISLIHRLKEEKEVTIISITHDLTEAAEADYLVVLNDGEVYQTGKPHDVFNDGDGLTEIGLDLPFSIRMARTLLGSTDFITYEGLVKNMTVKFSQVSYVYQKGTPFEHVALRDIETTFQQGKYYAVIGQTGSGKSTLIQHFNGLLKPSTGKLQIDDITITHKTKDKVLKQIRKRIGVVFQFPESQLFEDSVEREILFGPKNFNMPIDEVKARAYKLLIDFGFSRDILQQSPFQMSGGQMRKIAITSILAMDQISLY